MANDREKSSDVKPKSSRLFCYNILDVKDDIDEVIVKLQRAHNIMYPLYLQRLEDCQKCLSVTSGLRETELYEQLNKKVVTLVVVADSGLICS